jgi:hypothetical protein
MLPKVLLSSVTADGSCQDRSGIACTSSNASNTPIPNSEDLQASCSGYKEEGHGPVVLDVRNGYEWDAGHFLGAARPVEENFRETPRGNDLCEMLPKPLQDVSKDTTVMV